MTADGSIVDFGRGLGLGLGTGPSASASLWGWSSSSWGALPLSITLAGRCCPARGDRARGGGGGLSIPAVGGVLILGGGAGLGPLGEAGGDACPERSRGGGAGLGPLGEDGGVSDETGNPICIACVGLSARGSSGVPVGVSVGVLRRGGGGGLDLTRGLGVGESCCSSCGRR